MQVFGDWLTHRGTQAVMAMLEEHGHVAYAVGGCVRNAVLGEPVADVDISTDAHPERVMELAKASGLKTVPTGIDHGTITVVAHGEPYEVTTFRADVATDGRRAVVRFANTMAEDAIRRDFTMNAIYADRRGQVIDPLGGLPDLQARRFRFIQDPALRIQEDYLRILRFFRFSAWYADPAQGMDAEALAAIAENLDGLDRLSAERVGAEMAKLLRAPDPFFAVSVMEQTGALMRVLPGANAKLLGPLLHHESTLDLGPDPLRRMAGMGYFDGSGLRLSKADQTRLLLYHDLIGAPDSLASIAYRQSKTMALDVMVLRATSFESPLDIGVLPDLDRAASSVFPLTAQDLMPQRTGKALGQALKQAEERWIKSDFSLDKQSLIDQLQSD